MTGGRTFFILLPFLFHFLSFLKNHQVQMFQNGTHSSSDAKWEVPRAFVQNLLTRLVCFQGSYSSDFQFSFETP